ncbi:sterol desaturase family protein [Anabaena sp. UHCC 0253]|nr:sterol desaturase family protein [Anabaena sp. UHCC 0253]
MLMIRERLVTIAILFIILTIAFGIIEGIFPSITNQQKWRKGVWLDSFYWFFTLLISHLLSAVCIAIVIVPLFLVLGRSIDPQILKSSYGLAANLPQWVQGLMVIVIADFIGYWTHRWLHSSRLWDIHAVHHTSEELDWLSSVRVHPLNDIFSRVMQSLPILLLGFSPLSVEIYTPFLIFYLAFTHSNVPWNYGPFRYLIVSPVFHRWHHSKDTEGIGKNFAALFPVFDLMFGTFYLPAGKQPKNFGVHGDAIPEKFGKHLFYPFRKQIKIRFDV